MLLYAWKTMCSSVSRIRLPFHQSELQRPGRIFPVLAHIKRYAAYVLWNGRQRSPIEETLRLPQRFSLAVKQGDATVTSSREGISFLNYWKIKVTLILLLHILQHTKKEFIKRFECLVLFNFSTSRHFFYNI